MLLLEPFTKDQGRLMLHPLTDWHLKLTFVMLMGFYSRKLAYVLDSLVRVSRRGENNNLVNVNYIIDSKLHT